MQATQQTHVITRKTFAADTSQSRYARCIEASRRIRWDIDADVFRGRVFDYSQKFLPDGLSLVHELEFLDSAEKRFLSQIQGRTYAYIFGLVERFINAKVLEISQQHVLGDQVVLEALIRFSDEELKHQEMFRRIERMCAEEFIGDSDLEDDCENRYATRYRDLIIGRPPDIPTNRYIQIEARCKRQSKNDLDRLALCYRTEYLALRQIRTDRSGISPDKRVLGQR